MIVIATLTVTFFAGAIFGALAVLRLGTGRDDQDGRLRGAPRRWRPPLPAGSPACG